MLTLLAECHLWSIRDDEIQIKPTDYGAFRYTRKQQQQLAESANHAQVAKRCYTERRNGITVLKNSRNAGRLKENIKRLEELLRLQQVVHMEWREAPAQLLLLFANGIIAHICIDVYTGDIRLMVFEKYLVGKLAAEVITDAFFRPTHIVLAYNTNQLTVVHLQKPSMRSQGPEKIANMEPHIFHAIIPGQCERKLARCLSVPSGDADMFVIWTKSSQNEVYPWRPTIRDQDRANIHVFKLQGMQLELMSYCWSENDPLCVDFLRSSDSQILTVEQKVSRKGDISAEVCSYEISSGKMQRTALSSIAVAAQVCCYAFSPDQEKLFVGTIDHSIYLHDLVLQSAKFIAAIEIVPKHCSWHCDSSIIIVANDRAQFQCYDLALTPIASQLQSELLTPTHLLDLSHYFITQPNLVRMRFSRKPDLSNYPHSYAQTDCFLLMLCEHGPIGCLRFFGGAGMRGDIHNSGLTADVLVDKYLALSQLEKAVNLLTALNWETYGAMCLISLHKIANYVFFRGDAKRVTRIDLMMRALCTFADDVLSEETKDEFSDQVFDLKRRFFFYLLRRNLYAEAFEIAQDTEDYDLFMDLFNVTKGNSAFVDVSAAAFSQAAAIIQEEYRVSGNLSLPGDCRSESVCSQSTYSDIHASQSQNYMPPLPSFKSKVFCAEMIKINIPKPELRTDRPPPPPLSLPVRSIMPAPVAISDEVPGKNQLALGLKNSHQNTATLVWKDTTEQSVGLPIHSPSNGQTEAAPSLLPRASRIAAVNAAYMHYATPAVVTEHLRTMPAAGNYRAVPVPAPMAAYQRKFYQHPLVSGHIPATHKPFAILERTSGRAHELDQERLQMKPTASILSNSYAAQNGTASGLVANGASSSPTVKDASAAKGSTGGEKNKVKFSDTVQVAVVPEIPRKEKPAAPKRNGYSRPLSRSITNPRKELADSLPLCHPNDEYLKDFNPLSPDTSRPATKLTPKEEQSAHKTTPPPSIKVVHFGVV